MSEDNAAPEVPDEEIIADTLGSNDRIWRVPSKQALYTLSDQTMDDDLIGLDTYGRLPVRMLIASAAIPQDQEVVRPQQTTASGLIIQQRYSALQEVKLVPMDLFRIQIESGDRNTPSKAVTFQGTAMPDARRYMRKLRIIRVTVREDGYATYEVIAETRYPPH